MSRSYNNRKSEEVFVKIAGKSDKHDKQIANRKMRNENKKVSRNLKDNIDMDDYEYKSLREVSDTYNFASDGLAIRVKDKYLDRDNIQKYNRK